ncbi:polyketide cyclase [uncultured Jatrophihabitans sp.]|uniref:polyketide cyclase n=1 Tax=uncultured Jatrophihabitans sp. TaxID=1610747 RepID=UPI0035C94C7E
MADSDTSITVSRDIDHSAKDIFDVLSLPDRHAQLDGSGFVRSADHADRITANGQTFRMNMTGPHMGGDYQTDNVVTGFVRDKLISWKTAPAGTEPPGWEWVWELDPQGPRATHVTLTYDWSKVTDKELLKKVGFPLVSKHQMEQSLARLEETISGS